MKTAIKTGLFLLLTAAFLAVSALADPLGEESSSSSSEQSVSIISESGSEAGHPAEPVVRELGSFTVTLSPDAHAYYTDQVLTVTSGEAEITGGAPGERISLRNRCTLTLAGVSIEAVGGAGITLEPAAQATLILASGSQNSVVGDENYAGIQVSWTPERSAALTISGRGSLSVRGGRNSAGIGGSFDAGVLYGNITVNSGSISACGGDNAAGIGSAVNALGSQKSYKMDAQSWGAITIKGGTVNAEGNGSGAGIGGGNHADSGTILITGGTVNASGACGIGAGVGSSNQDRNGGKGPGYYFGRIEIQGGTVTARGSDNGAGIGGAMYSDGIVVITGGRVNATGGAGIMSRHGGAGIGGGFEGHGQVTVTGGTVTAQGGGGAGGIGSGGGANANGERGRGARGLAAQLNDTQVYITGGNVTATGGSSGGAGLGGGVGADYVNIAIVGGTVSATGAPGTRLAPQGGAGLGSGYSGMFPGTASPYSSEATVNASITGGRVRAVGGWGASAIGAGANNKSANWVEIGPDADITALSDGTRFALDTKPAEDGSQIAGRNIAGVFQGTFTDLSALWRRTDYEGQTVFLNRADATQTLTLPEGYRSFALSVPAGEYRVAAGKEYFAAGEPEQMLPDRQTRGHSFFVPESGFADVYYLSPTVTVTAEIRWDDADNLDRSRKDAVLSLMQSDTPGAIETAVVYAAAAEGERRVSWTDLPRYTADGSALRSYTVQPSEIEGYRWESTEQDGLILLTGSHTVERRAVTGELIWLGIDRASRPESVTLTLLVNGAPGESLEVKPGETGLWTYSFASVPCVSGQEIRCSASGQGLSAWAVIPVGENLLIASPRLSVRDDFPTHDFKPSMKGVSSWHWSPNSPTS